MRVDVTTTARDPRHRWRRSFSRWRLRWGRPLPWASRAEIIATLALWLVGTWTWERWQSGQPFLPPPPSSSPSASTGRAVVVQPLVTSEQPDADGLFAYDQDRLTVRVPVALRLAARSSDRPDLTPARGQDPGGRLRFELIRIFDPRARHADATDLAHDRAAAICRATGATLLDATDDTPEISGADVPAVHTVVHARLANGKPMTIEGLTFEDAAGPVAWTLWAGYPADDQRAAARVRASFASATLRPLHNQDEGSR